jgi:glycosyltransferase involved in cell wall biosynthesis
MSDSEKHGKLRRAEDLIREASEHAVARSQWLRRRQAESPAPEAALPEPLDTEAALPEPVLAEARSVPPQPVEVPEAVPAALAETMVDIPPPPPPPPAPPLPEMAPAPVAEPEPPVWMDVADDQSLVAQSEEVATPMPEAPPAPVEEPAPAVAPAPVEIVAPAEASAPVEVPAAVEEPVVPPAPPPPKRVPTRDASMAVFCFESPEGSVGQYLHQMLPALAERGTRVHLFTRNGFFSELASNAVRIHNVGEIVVSGSNDLFSAIEDFSKLAHLAFEEVFGGHSGDAVLLAHEWSGIHAGMALSAAYGLRTIFSIHSLECQRSDMSSALSKDIQEIERLGLRQSDVILVHNPGADPIVRQLAPESAARITLAMQPFPMEDFSGELDAGEVKARYQVGPIDPLFLFVGNFDHRHGPDILVKAVPSILRNQPQARFVLVGDGDMQWPMRVHARYLLLDYAVHFAGHLEGQPLRELIQAAQVVCVPSRERTEDWPIFAAWAAGKPVLATHNAGGSLLVHEQNALLIYPQENSFVWGAEKLLFDAGLRERLARAGRERLAQFGNWDRAAEQIQEAMGVLA